ncbi:hypothetical protein K8I31_14055, partial [bacterium]|nr:hypothetical protein [bacterium]
MNPEGGIDQYDWTFSNDFVEVDGGYAPTQLSRVPNKDARSIQMEFQVIDGVWIFKRGDSWLFSEDPSDPSFYSAEIIDFAL